MTKGKELALKYISHKDNCPFCGADQREVTQYHNKYMQQRSDTIEYTCDCTITVYSEFGDLLQLNVRVPCNNQTEILKQILENK